MAAGTRRSAVSAPDADDAADVGVRVGLVAYGVVHLLLAWLALQLALGDRGEAVSTNGALQELAARPLGGTLTWLVVAGLVVLVLVRARVAVVGRPGDPDLGSGRDRARVLRHRVTDAVMAVVYAGLGVSGLRIVLGAGGSRGAGSGGDPSEQQADTLSARVLALPAGPVLLGAVGVAVACVGLVLAWRGLSGEHRDKLSAEGRAGEAGQAYVLLGAVGHVAKGAVLVGVGALVVTAAVTQDPEQAGGVDQALGTLVRAPGGAVALVAVAAGLAAYGIFCLARARHLRSPQQA